MTEPIKLGTTPVGLPVPAPAPIRTIEADVTTLILGGVLERTVEPFKGWSVTLHTLTSNERIVASKAIPNDVLASLVASQEASKVPNLVQAITYIKVNSVEKHFSTPAEKESLNTMLSNSPAVVIDALYTEFLKATNDMYEMLETGVKKN